MDTLWGSQLYHFHFASLLSRDQLLQDGIFSFRSVLFPLRVDPFDSKQSQESFFPLYRASVSGRMDVIYVRILLPYAEKFDPGRMTYVQLLSVTSA